MRPVVHTACSVLLIIWQMVPADAQPAGRTLTFADAEREALANSVDVKVADSAVDAAEYGLKSSRTLRLPIVTLESNVLVWNESLEFDIALPGMMPPPGSEPEPITVRGRVTSTTTLSVGVPVSYQLVIRDLVKLQERGVRAATIDRDGARTNVAYKAADAYISVLLAQSAVNIATTRVKQLEAQTAQARILRQGGVLQKLDVLRLEAALAAARAEVINGESNVRLALDLLVLAVGLPPQTQLEVEDDFPESPAAPPHGAADGIQLAENRRSELGLLRMRTEQAHLAARVEKTKLLPDVLAVASFQHSEGGGTLQSQNAWFAGLTLSWDVWDWFGQWNKHKEAKAKATQAMLAQTQARDGIRTEVSVTANSAQAAHKLLAVTLAGVQAAEEAYRLQKDRFDEGAATTTDILDAEAELAQARLARVNARYSYFRALVRLAKSTGQLPSAVISKI
ncbi:MAG: TolC family protein [Proteobacteria bacterium]|nr:TolC family protein [Pseudomonadota bacterium]